jgi:molecular chaperone DnaJ
MQGSITDHDLYSVLGVHPTASPEEIRLAYRRRAMIWHPDRNRGADAEEIFKRIRSAYDVLRDRSRRADYDRKATQGAEGAQASAEPAENTVPREPDVRRRVSITLDEQLHGGRVELQVTRTEYCAACEGLGTRGERALCAGCAGAGYVRPTLGWFPLFGAAATACTECAGEGVTLSRCAACEGRGTIARKRGRLRFEIPAGIPPGGSLRVRGHGRRGRSGRAPGDLLISVAIASHPLFEPDFPHLRCEMPISVFRALAGGDVEVPTLDSPVSLPLPADVVDGTELRVSGHGMLNGATGRRGDLLVRLRLIRPRTLSGTQRELLAELERLVAHEPGHVDWVRRRRAAENMRRSTDRQPA